MKGCGDVYTEVDADGSTWALVMKLASNDFCFSSSRWTDGAASVRAWHQHLAQQRRCCTDHIATLQRESLSTNHLVTIPQLLCPWCPQAFNAGEMLHPTMPEPAEYDAKALAFHWLRGVDALRLQTARGRETTLRFAGSGTPEELMTTNDVAFLEYPDWTEWKAAFGSDRDRAPVFVRAGEVVVDPLPVCRNNDLAIAGCGRPCTFCMMAGDGAGCPTAGGGNDITSGLGGNPTFCGAGAAKSGSCSASGEWSGDNQVLVWARVGGQCAAQPNRVQRPPRLSRTVSTAGTPWTVLSGHVTSLTHLSHPRSFSRYPHYPPHSSLTPAVLLFRRGGLPPTRPFLPVGQGRVHCRVLRRSYRNKHTQQLRGHVRRRLGVPLLRLWAARSGLSLLDARLGRGVRSTRLPALRH